MINHNFKTGQIKYFQGCFTEEYFLRGLSVSQIGVELGLPSHRLKNGIYIAFAIKFPSFYEFKLGGWAEFSTDRFIEYRKGKMKWIETKFEETYKGKRIPISIDDAKKAWLENMKHEKLVKVIPFIPHHEEDIYPPGGRASQIIVVNPIQCQITNFLKGNQIFNGVWR